VTQIFVRNAESEPLVLFREALRLLGGSCQVCAYVLSLRCVQVALRGVYYVRARPLNFKCFIRLYSGISEIRNPSHTVVNLHYSCHNWMPSGEWITQRSVICGNLLILESTTADSYL
jgi:hypothetical protein